jgi:hypothetical protein
MHDLGRPCFRGPYLDDDRWDRSNFRDVVEQPGISEEEPAVHKVVVLDARKRLRRKTLSH